MKVLLVLNYGPDQQRSMLGYGRKLLEGLTELGLEVRSVAPKKRLGAGITTGLRGKIFGYADKYLFFRHELRQETRNADLVHVIDHGNSVYFADVQSKPNVVTCHDLIALRASFGELPNWKVSRTGAAFQRSVLKNVRKFDQIVAVSAATQRDVLRLTGLSQERVSVVPSAMLDLTSEISEEALRTEFEHLHVRQPYILHVGSNSPYKNRKGVVAIYKRLEALFGNSSPYLVMAGKPLPDELRHVFPSKAIAIENPTDIQVSTLYRHAEALIFPSLYEGLGLPVLEAQMNSCPVFASKREPMTEVGSNAAIYFDPEDHEGVARTIYENWDERDSLRPKGLENVRRFERTSVLKELIRVYESVLARTDLECRSRSEIT